MNLLENIRLALEGLRANKMRALLTMLGIIIGISSVISISTLGNAMTSSVTDSFNSMGGKNINVFLMPKDYNTMSTMTEEDRFSTEELSAFQEKYSTEIKALSLSSSLGSGEVKSGYVKQEINLSGVNPGYGIANKINMLQGRFINDMDILNNRNVIIIEKALKNRLVGSEGNVIGQEVMVETKSGNDAFTVVGVYEAITDHGPLVTMGSQRLDLYIPVTTGQFMNDQDPGYDNFTIMANDDIDSKTFALEAKDYLNKNLASDSDFIVESQSMEAIVNEASAALGTLSLGISIIAGISLLVGGIGVMNIMLVSVTERTKEIGIRKALGAKNSAIRIQFIVEAIIICLIGGIIGICLGAALGTLGSSLLKFPVSVPTNSVIMALCFSMAIGIFFGYYPANKAAKLNPIDALRYE